MIYLHYDNMNPYRNLAFEEYVLRNRQHGDYLLLWRSTASVILGRNQNLYEEVNVQLAEQLGIPILRRESGGGAVFHDPGNLNFSFITYAGAPESRTMDRFAGPVARALKEWGIPAVLNGRNDITVNGLKVSGSAQTIWKDRILHHGTLLFSADLSLAHRLLHPDPRKLESNGAASVRSRIGNLQEYLPEERHGAGIEELKDHLLKVFQCVTEIPGAEELEAVNIIADETYRDPQRLLEESTDFNYQSSMRLPGGTVAVRVQIEEHRIREIRISGDFLSTRPIEELEKTLIGTDYEHSAVMECLNKLTLQPYLGSITAEQLADIIV